MPQPATVLFHQLAAARRAGASFEHAWPEAVAVAVRAAAPRERGEWRAVFNNMVSTWQAAWERKASG